MKGGWEAWLITWQRLWAMTRKELAQIWRDKGLIAMVAFAFTGDVFVAGSSFKMELKNAQLVVYDADGTPASRDLISRFRLPEFSLQDTLSSPQEGLARLDSGKAMVMLDIPKNFSRDLTQGKQTQVQVQVDASNSVLGTWASSYAAQIVGGFAMEKGMGALSTRPLPVIEDQHRAWFNPNGIDEWFVPVIEMLNMVTMLSLMLPAAAMVREKERGTIEQLLVSPLSPLQIMFPKVIAMTVVILVGLNASLLVLRFIFEVPIRGSLLSFYFLSAVYVTTTSGLGLALATVVRNLAQVGMMIVMFMGPILMLSGTWVPAEGMAPGIRWVMSFSPLHYYVEVAMGIFLRGVGWEVLWRPAFFMTLLGVFFFGLGAWRFRGQFG